ncbi:MAG: four helix bundle protein [Anaerolineae bacterium]|jgi:four helix bundle protein|nr:four helix bundle protein [Anaerolineae bacterium]MDH7473245.1 four helix bundle protein [Anaerolineae bacterium]
MPTIERFEDLRVWQEAREIVNRVYRLTVRFPSSERYGLASQMQRAAVSTMSNIAEGFERGTTKEFITFLYIAKGSNGEVRSQAYVALDLGYIPQAECDDLVHCCERLSRRIYNFIEYLKRTPIKGPRVREPGPVWYLDEPET